MTKNISLASASSCPIQANLTSVTDAYAEYTRSLDEISADIREVEKKLKTSNVTVSFSHQLGSASGEGYFSQTSLSWEKYQDQGFRLLFKRHVGGAYVASERFEKPLIECPADTRIDYYGYLGPFLEAFAEELKKAKVAREQAVADFVAHIN